MSNNHKKLTCLTVATMLGAALIAAPAHARGAVHSAAVYGGAVGAFGGAGLRAAAIGPSFARRAGWWSGRRLGPLLGFGLGLGTLSAAADSTCWTWVQTPFGWQRVWAVAHCGLGYGGNVYGPYW